MLTLEKIKNSIVNAPVGAIAGAITGYVIAKNVGYHKTFVVVSFAMVGIIIGTTLEYKLRNK